jgi:hypothetical protein
MMSREEGVEMQEAQTEQTATEDFKRLIEPMTRRIKTQARFLALVFLALGIMTALLIGAAALTQATPDEDVREDLRMMLGGFLMCGCASLGIRWAIRRDLKYVHRLLTRGASYAGRIAVHRIRPSGMSHVRVVWDENGAIAGASFDTNQLSEPVPRSVQVRAVSKKSHVGVAINGELYIARRFTPRA